MSTITNGREEKNIKRCQKNLIADNLSQDKKYKNTNKLERY